MSATWKTVRVFISSTFRDMHAERDHLVRFVFPRLREQLLPRRIHLVDVDLRWGVTSEQDASEVCREIINECRPRFLCILGGRYGWVPPGKTHSITADEVHFGVLDRALTDRGFASFYFRDDDATAAMVETTASEFREVQGSDNETKLRELKQAITTAGLNPFTYPARWDNDSRRLTDLKTFGDQVYEDLFASLKADPDVRDRFAAEAAAQPDEFAEENDAMEAFIEERTERFVLGSREPVLNELLAHASATGDNGYVCLLGSAGSGKSALLAYLTRRLITRETREIHESEKDSTASVSFRGEPAVGVQASACDAEQAKACTPTTPHSALHTPHVVIPHFVGASAGSTDVRRTLRRLCHELKKSCREITADIPDDFEKLRAAFPDFLRQACASKRVVILLDAINQFDTTAYFSGLHWLPEDLPENARMILSVLVEPRNGVGRVPPHGESAAASEVRSSAFTRSDGTKPPEGGTPNPTLDELRRRRVAPMELELKPLTANDGEAIIEQLRKRYHKRFSGEQRTALLAKAEAGTPLYLLTALEELRTLSVSRQVADSRDQERAVLELIAELPPTTQALFAWILERLENDDGFRDAAGRKSGKELVPRFAALLSASRHGLSQHELVDLLAPGDPQGNVAALLHLLRPHLMPRGELLDFYHGQFRNAAEQKHLHTEPQRHDAHAQLARYFRFQADPETNQSWKANSPRPLAELPFHLAAAHQWEELAATLSNLKFVIAKASFGLSYDLIHDFDDGLAVQQIIPTKRIALVQLRHLVWRQAATLCRFPALVRQQVLLGLGRFGKLDPALVAQAACLADEARAAGLHYAEVALPEFVADEFGLPIETGVDALAATPKGVLVWQRGGQWFDLSADGAILEEGHGPVAPISRLAKSKESLAAASAQFVLLWQQRPTGVPQRLRHTATVEHIVWSNDGSRLLVIGSGGMWWLYQRRESSTAWSAEKLGEVGSAVVGAWIETDGSPTFVNSDGCVRRAQPVGYHDIQLTLGTPECAACDTTRKDIFVAFSDGMVCALSPSGNVLWKVQLPAPARQLNVAEDITGARLLAALTDGSLWICDTATGAKTRRYPISQNALTTVVPLPKGSGAVVRDYTGSIALVAIRPAEPALAVRVLPARGRIRAMYWDEEACAVRGVDEDGAHFSITRTGKDWTTRTLPKAPSPTSDCMFFADGRLVTVKADLSNNEVYLHERNGGRSQVVWPSGIISTEPFRTLSVIGITPDGSHGAFAIRRPGVGGVSVCLFTTTPWREIDRLEFPDREICRIAPANGLRRVLFGFLKLIEPPVLWTREGMSKLPIEGGVKPAGLEAGAHHSLRDLAISADGLRYLGVDRHGNLWQFDHLEEGRARHRMIGVGKVACDLSADGKLAAVLSGTQFLEILELGPLDEPRRLCEFVAPWDIEVFQLVPSHPMVLLGGRGGVCAYSFNLDRSHSL